MNYDNKSIAEVWLFMIVILVSLFFFSVEKQQQTKSKKKENISLRYNSYWS